MNSIRVILLSSLLFALQFCSAVESKNNKSCWLNVEYINCLKNKLPCECEKHTETYFSLIVDTDTLSKTFGIALSKYEQMEPHFHPILEVDVGEYKVISNAGVNWAKLKFNSDTLSLIENGEVVRFVKIKDIKKFDALYYAEHNIKLLNKAFKERGYNTLESITGQDSLKCECNKWLENSNVVYKQGNSQAWILELVDDSLRLQRIIHNNGDPDDPIITETVNTYKW